MTIEPERSDKEKRDTESIQRLKQGADLATEILSLAEHVTQLMQKKDKTPEDEQRLRQWQAYIKLGKHLASMVGDAAVLAEQKDTAMENVERPKKDTIDVQ